VLIDLLAYRTARNSVRAFASEGDEIVARNYQAEECRDCESFLQLGIDAYRWLRRADVQVRRAVAEGRLEASSSVDRAIEALFRLWLPPIEAANRWIEMQRERHFAVENLEQFRQCERDVRAIVAEFDKLKAAADRVPPPEDLALIAADPKEWLSEPAWVRE